MTERKLDLQTMELIALFERMTRVPAIDFIETDPVAYFVVPPGAVKRLHDNRGLERLGKRLGKTVRLVEHRDSPEAFLRQLFWHYGVERAECRETPDGLEARVSVSPLRKGRAIGRGGENLNALRELARRHVGIERLVLE